MNNSDKLALDQLTHQTAKNQILGFLHLLQVRFDNKSLYDYQLYLYVFYQNLKLKDVMINKIITHIFRDKFISCSNKKYTLEDLLNYSLYSLNDLNIIINYCLTNYNESTFEISDELNNYLKQLFNKDINNLIKDKNEDKIKTNNNQNVILTSELAKPKRACAICGQSIWNNKQIPLTLDPNCISDNWDITEKKFICFNCLIVGAN